MGGDDSAQHPAPSRMRLVACTAPEQAVEDDAIVRTAAADPAADV
jgi:hypothetical protein